MSRHDLVVIEQRKQNSLRWVFAEHRRPAGTETSHFRLFWKNLPVHSHNAHVKMPMAAHSIAASRRGDSLEWVSSAVFARNIKPNPKATVRTTKRTSLSRSHRLNGASDVPFGPVFMVFLLNLHRDREPHKKKENASNMHWITAFFPFSGIKEYGDRMNADTL